MFRKLPNTIKLLDKINKGEEFAVFDFKIHNILAPTSVDNQVPIFAPLDRFMFNFEGDQAVDNLGETALWNQLRELGFVSLLGLENCDSYFPKSLGRKPNVDYSAGPFYCMSYDYADYKMEKEAAVKQRCIGPNMSHHHILKYTLEATRLNAEVNQFQYLHLNAGHEATGLHAETLDDDLVEFLKTYLEEFGEGSDIAIFLQADHGMRYGNWFKDLAAYQENKLPSFFFLGSRSLLDSREYSYDTILHNTQRITSKLDIRKTILGLVGLNETFAYSALDLLSEKAKNSRTCDVMGINPWDCSCLVFEEIDPVIY
jgi:hypothetical protein